ncbi:hypothetical protein [Rhodopseudomonas palustris]|uniref:hypothetical protein n=1 Tax=Rhodopseudomonas palustris TaxID=1076 RepID=UPI00131D9434|nr:hypothetical protein [Rhodopseudomonas palustris]
MSKLPQALAREQDELRDTFAGLALMGFLSNANTQGGPKEFAQSAYTFADAMLAERAKRITKKEE